MSASAPVRVALVEDHARFRSTMEQFVAHLPGFELASSYAAPRAALDDLEGAQSAGRPPPWNLVLMDLELPGVNGIEATRRIKALAPDVLVVVLTVFEDPATILEAISAGADGYLVKRSSAAELRTQLLTIVRDGAPLTPGVARTLLAFVRQTSDPARAADAGPSRLDLTGREQDVLRCIVRGRSYQQAAGDLEISVETVRTHIRNLYRKLQVHTVAEAVALAIRKKLI